MNLDFRIPITGLLRKYTGKMRVLHRTTTREKIPHGYLLLKLHFLAIFTQEGGLSQICTHAFRILFFYAGQLLITTVLLKLFSLFSFLVTVFVLYSLIILLLTAVAVIATRTLVSI